MAASKGLRPVSSITEHEALADIRGPPPPPGVPMARWRGRVRGSAEGLAWHRGHHTGVYDAALTIRKRYPRVAKQLLDAFKMDSKGVITL